MKTDPLPTLSADLAAAVRDGDLHRISQLHFERALVLCKASQPFKQDLVESQRASLASMRAEGGKVKVITGRDKKCCAPCRALEGIVFPIDSAPIPAETCAGTSVGAGWCRCTFASAIDP